MLLGLVALAVPVPRLPALPSYAAPHDARARLRMTVAVTLDMLAATPPYEQVRSQIAGHIRTGNIRPGEKLPVVRALAADLGVATNTIARAYRELEAGGLVTTRRRVGTIVQAVPARPAPRCSSRPPRSCGTPATPGSRTRRSSTWSAAP